jgi:hypothetical protein
MDYLLSSIRTRNLKKKQIIDICKLKNTFWQYGFKSNYEWFKDKVKENDINNLIYHNSRLIGYTLLKFRTFYSGKLKKKYIYFDTFIINKKFRNRGISYYLMNFNNEIILKNNKFSFLICLNDIVNFYKKFGWKKMKNSSFNIIDHNFHTNGMYYNFKKFDYKKKYDFYVYK